MPSLEDLQKGALDNIKYISGVSEDATAKYEAQKKQAIYQAAAKQASDLYLQGNASAAFAVMFQTDPDLSSKLTQQLQTAATTQNPELQGQLEGAKEKAKLTAQQPFQSTPGQIAETKGDVKDNQTYSYLNPKTGDREIARRGGGRKIRTVGEDASGTTAEAADQGQPLKMNQEYDSKGTIVDLKPNQVKGIIKDVKDWNKESSKDVEAINNATLSKKMIIDSKNFPQATVIEQLRTLKAAVGSGRVAVQELQAMGGKDGVYAKIENAISDAKGEGMGDTSQKNMLNLVSAIQDYNLDEYNTKLHLRVTQSAKDNGVDTGVVFNRMAPTFPTSIQNARKAANNLSPEDQQYIKLANKYLLTHKRGDPDYQDALKVLRKHGL